MIKGEQNELHPVPAGMVQEDQQSGELMVEMEKQSFDQSPSFTEDELAEMSEQWPEEVRAYFDEQSSSEQETK